MTPAQDIDADFNHLIALCMHSWSEREVVAAVRRLQDKVHEQLQPTDLIYSKDRHALALRPDLHPTRTTGTG